MGASLSLRAAGRLGAPPRAAAALSVPALLIAWIPGAAAALQYDRAAVAAGEVYRILTSHWTHWSVEHLLWDLVVFAVLLTLGLRTAPGATLLALGSAIVAIPLAVQLALPELDRYRGLSGLDSALFVIVAVCLLRERLAERRGGAWPILLLLAGFLVKLGVEIATDVAVFVRAAEFVPVPLAHVVGAACGALAASPGARARRSGQAPGRWRRADRPRRG